MYTPLFCLSHQLALEDGREYRKQEKEKEEKQKNNPNAKPIVLKNPLAQMQKAFNTQGIQEMNSNPHGLAVAKMMEGLKNEPVANGNGYANGNAPGDSDDMEE